MESEKKHIQTVADGYGWFLGAIHEERRFEGAPELPRATLRARRAGIRIAVFTAVVLGIVLALL